VGSEISNVSVVEETEWMTVKEEAAEVTAILGVSKSTVSRLVDSDELPGMRVGRSIRINRKMFDRQYNRDKATA
jgi:excisionase family DNA binding protein